MGTQPLILTELRPVTNTNIVIGNREQSSVSMAIILARSSLGLWVPVLNEGLKGL